MNLSVAFVTCSVLVCVSSPMAVESLNQRSKDAIKALVSANREGDVERIAGDFRDLAGTPTLCVDAIRIASSSLGREATGRMMVMRLISLSVALESERPNSSATQEGASLDTLESQDIQALRSE